MSISVNSPPKITIITVVRNAEALIERTVDSIIGQSYGRVEYIVIDGASVDGTLSRLQAYGGKIDRLISEPDDGISDAWNKGLGLATGEIVGLLNAGDEYAANAVSNAVTAIQLGADLVYGDTDLVGEMGNVISKNRGRFHLWLFSGGIGFYHPTVFARRSVYDKVGVFDKSLKYAMDTDWIVRAMARGCRIRHAAIKVKMLDGGVSVNNRFNAYGEYLQILKRNDIPERVIYLSMIGTGLRGLFRCIMK